MTIDSTDTIDMVKRAEDGSLTLVLVDPLAWGDPEHLFQLQEKLNSYIAYVESGQYLELEGADRDARVSVDIVMQHAPDRDAEDFLFRAGEIMSRAGIGLTHRVHPT